jgi:glycine/D-amino acid oxidase-like deaminating enzyme
MIEQADAVVVGSGALGASTAFHLLKAGMTKVALLDQHAIGSQTSPRAAGLTQQVRESELMTDLARRAVEKICRFEQETGEPLVFHQSGSLKIARTPDHARQLRDEVARGQRLGIDIDFVAPEEATRLMPFFRPVGVAAISYARTDLYLEPSQIPLGYARAFARLGGAVMPDTRVERILVGDGGVRGVQTGRGEIQAPVVVDAGGAWLRQIGQTAAARAGAVPMRHQLFITEPIEGVDPMQPIARVIDACVYIRPADGGLMLGGYENDPLAFDMAREASGFSIDQMPLDFTVLKALREQVLPQFPVFADAKIREHRGGLPTMTADGEHIVGPWPGISGLYLIGGCCVGGLSISPILGELLAGWIVSGRPGADFSTMAPGRAAVAEIDEQNLQEGARRRYARHYWSEGGKA